jgi:hypothetical protein
MVLSVVDVLPAPPILILDLCSFPPLVMTDVIMMVVFVRARAGVCGSYRDCAKQ